MDKIIQDKKEVYFFVSHVHYDHFNPKISEFKNKVTKYFISYDVVTDVLPKEKTIILDEYMTYDDKIYMYAHLVLLMKEFLFL